MQKMFTRVSAVLFVVAFMLSGCAQPSGQQTPSSTNAAVTTSKKSKGPVYKGRVVGKSVKAKTISIQVGKGKKAQTIMVKFDQKTTGVEHAGKGHGVIISYEKRGKEIYAKSIKPKLAKLPKGVALIKIDELKKMVDKGEDHVLVDSRPAARYGQSHLPGAISIPVCEMQELIGLLPKKKDTPLIFYCGGPT